MSGFSTNGMDRAAFDISTWEPTEEQWQHSLSLIEPEERERIGRFNRPGDPPLVGRSNPDAKASLIGRLLIQYVVHEQCKIPYEQMKFGRTKENKPYLINKPEEMPLFNFNVAHAGNHVVCASEGGYLVGVDVMELKIPGRQTVNDFFSTMKSCFTAREWAAINSFGDNENRIRLFFVHWCLKEAYIKAVGIGLGFELQRLQFVLSDELHPTSATLYIDNRPHKDWCFQIQDQDQDTEEGYIIATAIGPINQAIESFKATMDENHLRKAQTKLENPNKLHVPMLMLPIDMLINR